MSVNVAKNDHRRSEKTVNHMLRLSVKGGEWQGAQQIVHSKMGR